MSYRGISVAGRQIPLWALVMAMVAAASMAAATSLAAPQAEVKVAVSQTVVLDSGSGWVLGHKFDVATWKSIGQGQEAKIVIMGQGGDYGWFNFTLNNLAGTDNLVRIYAINVPPELKVKFTKVNVTVPSYELFDTSYAKIGAGCAAKIYMYVLIKPGTPQTNLEFEVKVEVLGC